MPFNAAELTTFLRRTMPAIDLADLIVEQAGETGVRLRFPFKPAYIGPGEIFSGPATLGFADTAIYAAAQALLGDTAIAVVATMNFAFLAPAKAGDIIATAEIRRAGKRLLHAVASLGNDGGPPVLTATAALSLIPNRM